MTSNAEDYDESKNQTISIYLILFSGLLTLALIFNKLLHQCPLVSIIISEAALVMLIGMVAGFFVHWFLLTDYGIEHSEQHDLGISLISFQDRVFFMALLPPILFNSGYELNRELFFHHIKPILLFSCVGTTISALAAGFFLFAIRESGLLGGFNPSLLELLTFGSLIAATDTVTILAVFQAKRVDPKVFYLIFGESALNDAVALILFHTFADFMNSDLATEGELWKKAVEIVTDLSYKGFCSPLLGTLFSFIMAMVFKYIDFREFHMLELSLYVSCMYLPFLIAESLDLSGIVSIFFSGLMAKRYIVPNISLNTKEVSVSIFKLAAFLAETCIFLDLGLSVFGLTESFDPTFIPWAYLATLFGRALGVYPVAYVYNISLREKPIPETIYDHDGDESASTMTPVRRKDKKISLNMAHLVWFSGLRGAVAYACARQFPDVNGSRSAFIATTMVIVLGTIILQGSATGCVLSLLGIDMGIDMDEYMKEWKKQRKLKGRFHEFGKLDDDAVASPFRLCS